jgi:hypothetical protein
MLVSAQTVRGRGPSLGPLCCLLQVPPVVERGPVSFADVWKGANLGIRLREPGAIRG